MLRARWRDSIQSIYRALEKFVDIARQKRFVPLVMYVPTVCTIYQESVEFEDENITALMCTYSQAQRDWSARNAKQIGYEFLDPTKFLQERALTGPLLYFSSDMHPTPDGHNALAEAVALAIANILKSPGQVLSSIICMIGPISER